MIRYAASSTQIRWMIRRDLPTVLEIDRAAFRFHEPWGEEQYTTALRQRNCIGMIIEAPIAESVTMTDIVGMMVYSLQKKRLELIRIAVDPTYQRSGLGTLMIEKLKGKLSDQRRNRITAETTLANVEACKFFKSCGFRAVSFDAGTDDLLMSFSILE